MSPHESPQGTAVDELPDGVTETDVEATQAMLDTLKPGIEGNIGAMQATLTDRYSHCVSDQDGPNFVRVLVNADALRGRHTLTFPKGVTRKQLYMFFCGAALDSGQNGT